MVSHRGCANSRMVRALLQSWYQLQRQSALKIGASQQRSKQPPDYHHHQGRYEAGRLAQTHAVCKLDVHALPSLVVAPIPHKRRRGALLMQTVAERAAHMENWHFKADYVLFQEEGSLLRGANGAHY
eukprot:CAMPEP_0115832052 /NCGR_PEP_ID=MMETSP0287-20121206/2457_1 /TAXON_ID=412157 /ORGANISM="Chrysochromulina rotalis, Strain UIO044" /LENGTH=126 /DNA_ID=CAMNT_0003285421 /DNA_START=152 /DNA_END=534 /DNA_ORIENTATION=-